MSIGENVRKLRKEKGWSLNKLSLKSGIPASTIHGIEKGANPSYEKVEKLIKVFNVSTNKLSEKETQEGLSSYTTLELVQEIERRLKS